MSNWLAATSISYGAMKPTVNVGSHKSPASVLGHSSPHNLHLLHPYQAFESVCERNRA